MTEREFWQYMKKAWEKGRVPMVSGQSLKSSDPVIRQGGEYMGGHSVLPEDYDKIPIGIINEMGELLMQRDIRPQTKEAVMMILAHHGSDDALDALKKYLRDPDPSLKIFAEIALSECEMWNEDWRHNKPTRINKKKRGGRKRK